MYFITICSKNREQIFGQVVGDGDFDVPQMKLSYLGNVVDKYIHKVDNLYNNVFIDKFVIMPNHIHMMIAVSNADKDSYNDDIRVSYYGTSKIPSPTDLPCKKTTLTDGQNRANEIIPKFISLFKRYCNREIGHDIWQRSYYDHIIRSENDYKSTWLYIDNNPARWAEDEYF